MILPIYISALLSVMVTRKSEKAVIKIGLYAAKDFLYTIKLSKNTVKMQFTMKIQMPEEISSADRPRFEK